MSTPLNKAFLTGLTDDHPWSQADGRAGSGGDLVARWAQYEQSRVGACIRYHSSVEVRQFFTPLIPVPDCD